MWSIIDIVLVSILVIGAGVLLIKKVKNFFKDEDSLCAHCDNKECPYKTKNSMH